MKQGRASSSGPASHKREPNSKAVNPAFPGQIGLQYGNHSDEGMGRSPAVSAHQGRGYKAPAIGTAIHHSGSQGKHR